MSTSANYAATPRDGVGTVSIGDTSRTAPTSYAIPFIAGPNGSRIDNIDIEALGSTPTASTVRIWKVVGYPGNTISSITFSSTTATVTTAAAHGLTTGNLVTVQNTVPRDYQVTNVAITVTAANIFTYTMATTPTANAEVVGNYSFTTATPTYNLWQEVSLPSVTASSSTQVAVGGLSSSTPSSLLPLVLPSGWQIRATLNDTQTVAVESPVSVAASQSVAANAQTTLNGTLAIAAVNNAICTTATAGSASYKTLTTQPYTMPNVAQVTINSGANNSGESYIIVGQDATGATISETIVGPNVSTVYSVNQYAVVSSVYVNGTETGASVVGYSAVVPFSSPTKILITSSANLSGLTFTITGTASNGTALSETGLAGPTAGGYVVSAKAYKSITSVVPSNTANPTVIGTPAITTGVNCWVRGGDF